MEISEFTFYESYWDVIKAEGDAAIRDVVVAICEFMFCGKTTDFNDLTMSLIWNEILDVLKPEREKRLSGKTNHSLKWTGFTFKRSYWTMLESLSNSDRFAYIKAICVYAFENKEPKKKEVPSEVYKYFNISKMAIDVSIKRKAAGRKGGTAVRRKAVDEFSAEPQSQDAEASVDEHVQSKSNAAESIAEPVSSESSEREADKKVITIDSLDELGCYGRLNPNNPILDGVDMDELYDYVKMHPEAQKQSKYNAVMMFKNSKKK